MSKFFDGLTEDKLLLIAQALDSLEARHKLSEQCQAIRHAVGELLTWAGEALGRHECEECP